MFFERDKTKQKQYKIGYIRDANHTPFKYNKLNRTDIRKMSDFGVNIDEESFIIFTTSPYEFNTDTTIEINKIYYNIRAIYYEDDEFENNMFNQTLNPKRYLNLIVDR